MYCTHHGNSFVVKITESSFIITKFLDHLVGYSENVLRNTHRIPAQIHLYTVPMSCGKSAFQQAGNSTSGHAQNVVVIATTQTW